MTESPGGLRTEAAAFGAVLRGYRRAAGLTQEALAARSGQSRRGLQHLEAGDALPHPATLEALTSALALSPAERARLWAAGRPAVALRDGPQRRPRVGRGRTN